MKSDPRARKRRDQAAGHSAADSAPEPVAVVAAAEVLADPAAAAVAVGLARVAAAQAVRADVGRDPAGHRLVPAGGLAMAHDPADPARAARRLRGHAESNLQA